MNKIVPISFPRMRVEFRSSRLKTWKPKTCALFEHEYEIDLIDDRMYALYTMEKWDIHPESVKIIEYNLSFDKSNWFSITHGEVEDIKGYIKGSIKDMQSLLMDVGNNTPMEEERFSKVEDERVSLRCSFRKVC